MKTTLFKSAFIFSALLTVGSSISITTQAQPVETLCNPSNSSNGFGAGNFNGAFYSWFELASNGTESNCTNKIAFYDDYDRHFRVEWNMPRTWGEDSIGGMGWENGNLNRKIGYWAGEVTSNSPRQKALTAMYGWSCYQSSGQQISQEYYIVDSWAGPGTFVPWDENANGGNGGPANSIDTVTANGATYNVYKVGRNGAQYCFNGANRTFEQYWSVRDNANGTGQANEIDFRPHANKWDNHGFQTGGLNNGYQILAIEVFGDANLNHSGAVDVTTWER